MNALSERALAQAHALRARGSALPPDGPPREEILDSWCRSRAAGLDCGARASVGVVDAHDLVRRRDRAAVVRRLAQAELGTLAQQIAGSNFLLAFADPDGVILDLYADNRFQMAGSTAQILAGSLWSEAACGTNGLGTALACGHSVAVEGLEHYLLELGDISCTATPVRDAHGEVVGVLDASSYFESRQRHTQTLVQMAAAQMESGLFAYQMRHEFILAIHPRREFLNTLGAGLLAIGADGNLRAVNSRGRQLLQGRRLTPGIAFAELFGESFDALVERLRRGDEARLRDTMGSALAARCLGDGTGMSARRVTAARPRAAAPAAPAGHPRPCVAEQTSCVPAIGALPFVAEDARVREAVRLVEAAVRMRVPVLILGETGTGKELLARHAHAASGRPGAFVAVNCAALPHELFEAELFGYVGGAFSGARREGHSGLMASAHRGTLLLDEIRELPTALQAALLRFLDDGCVRPVGGTALRQVDVQILAATNVDPADDLEGGRLRADLLYRLDTVRAQLPPLRHRRDFAAAARATLSAIDPAATLADDAIAYLARGPWPGNFRQLRAVLTRVLIAQPGGQVCLHDVESLVSLPARVQVSALQRDATETVCREFVRTGCSVSRTSRNLGISRTTVYRHLRAAGR
jgi:transcriptional regulator of acetoin/glycerol metabolism